ncbi:MAG TPA: NADH-quinone oxidoreductase subunit C [Longilinea sp.]|nr:NADH-quinone oxidoreductase subunit C [Longilinea sp.]
MNEVFQPAVSALTQRVGAQVSEFRGEVTLLIAADKIVEACRALKEEFGFDFLIAVTGVDYWPEQEPRFNIVYLLYSFTKSLNLNVRVPLNGNAPHVPTVESVYPNANWYEREVWDMFGVRFDGHSDMRRILMPADWEGHPLRKDYPLGYEEVQFSFNYKEVDEKKPYAKD